MRTTERFEKAVTKLYKAFHDCTLNAYNCEACAVGNICGNKGDWSDIIFMPSYRADFDAYKEMKPNRTILKTGYSVFELAKVEDIFIEAHRGEQYFTIKEKQFKGLCSVIEYLCELDNIPNPMDYSKLFETENNKPKYELSL